MFDDLQSSDEESPVPDADVCNRQALQQLFQAEIKPSAELSTSLKRTCGLHLALSCDSRLLAVGLSRKELQLYRLEDGAGSLMLERGNFATYQSGIRGVRFFNGDANSLMCCTADGSIHLYDVRTGKGPVHRFEDTTSMMTSFDINRNDHVVCAATEVQKNGESFLLFYDARERKYVGCYCECHSDDVTRVKFHPEKPDYMASASVDGLINVFDISNSNEDDALEYSLNANDPVDAIHWHTSDGADRISCVTGTNGWHLYDVESQDCVAAFDREAITKQMWRTSSIDCNVIAMHNDSHGNVLVLAGSNYNKGECLRTLRYKDKSLLPGRNFVQNKQIVRASVFNEKEQCLLTTGESGLITLWRYGDDASATEETHENSASKSRLEKANRRAKPY